MHKRTRKELDGLFRRQHGVVARRQLAELGVATAEVRRRVKRGDWEAVGRLVVRLAGTPPEFVQAVWAAYLAAGPGAVVSHATAAWLWGLAPAPARPTVSVPRSAASRVQGAVVCRPSMPIEHVSHLRGLPCTDPLRTIVDLAAELDRAAFHEVIDRAMARELVTIEALAAEVGRSAGMGRQGPSTLRTVLEQRGYVGVPAPSALENRFARLLRRASIVPAASEVRAGPDGCYRIDVHLDGTVFVELDGYAYHSSPEQKGYDERRRNRLRLEGRIVLVYTWRDVTRDGPRVIAEIREALSQDQARRAAADR